MTIVAIHQPNLFPRLKVLNKLATADLWVVLDNVQFAHREYQNRALLVPNHGSSGPHWCTVPVHLPKGQDTRIDEVEFVENARDLAEHLERSVASAFRAFPDAKAIRERIMRSIENVRTLTELGVATTLALLEEAGCTVEVRYASELESAATEKSARIASICAHVGASVYIADSGAARYLEESAFGADRPALLWQVWRAPEGAASRSLELDIRNGSALNLAMRSPREFASAVRTGSFSRFRSEVQ